MYIYINDIICIILNWNNTGVEKTMYSEFDQQVQLFCSVLVREFIFDSENEKKHKRLIHSHSIGS